MSSTIPSGQRPTASDPARPLLTPIKRRSFFMYAGATAGATAPVYGPGADAAKFPAEDNMTHGGLNVQTGPAAPTGLTITAAAASEAFDEPLDAVTVKNIARNFRSAKGVTLGVFA